MKGLTDVPGILVGHASDPGRRTGCTVVLCGTEAVGGVDVRGPATGSVELDVLSPRHVAPYIHAIVLAGGSAFGLEASSGTRRVLARRGVGIAFGGTHVPIVSGAILFDLGFNQSGVHPDREMGEKATAAADSGPVAEGNVGAGTGATVGKIFGLGQAMKAGVGSASVTLGSGVVVAAMVVVNALGDVRDPSTGSIVAGARKSPGGREFANSAAVVRHGMPGTPAGRGNTTLSVVATNARLDKTQANHLAAMASHGIIRTISPVSTMADGDITFALSLGKEKANVDSAGVAAAEVLATAVIRAVKAARTAGGVPGLAG